MISQDSLSNSHQLPISRSCLVLEVSRSGYYDWLSSSETVPADSSEYLDLNNQIQEIASEFPYYGYRRITAEHRNRSYAVNHKRVLRIIRQEKLLCHKTKFKPITTDSTHGLPIYPNLLKGREITGVNQVWASVSHMFSFSMSTSFSRLSWIFTAESA
jgi:putative transposase